jgi:hypothetical protein
VDEEEPVEEERLYVGLEMARYLDWPIESILAL